MKTAYTHPDNAQKQMSLLEQESDQEIELRGAVVWFAEAMEAKLRKNDHKNKAGWEAQPIEALFKLLLLEVEEFKVADEFFDVDKARKELVDIANFSLILHHRLGMLEQDKNRHAQNAVSK